MKDYYMGDETAQSVYYEVDLYKEGNLHTRYTEIYRDHQVHQDIEFPQVKDQNSSNFLCGILNNPNWYEFNFVFSQSGSTAFVSEYELQAQDYTVKEQ